MSQHVTLEELRSVDDRDVAIRGGEPAASLKPDRVAGVGECVPPDPRRPAAASSKAQDVVLRVTARSADPRRSVAASSKPSAVGGASGVLCSCRIAAGFLCFAVPREQGVHAQSVTIVSGSSL
jgi:hypothetical protein